MYKKLWLKVSNKEEYLRKEGDIFAILKTAHKGTDEAVLYTGQERATKTLLRRIHVSNELTQAFASLLGDHCVKVTENHDEMWKYPHTECPEIIQVIPCNDEVYAVFSEDDNDEEDRSKVLALALCDDGEVHPLTFDGELGVSLLCDNDHVKKFVIKDSRIADNLEGINAHLDELKDTMSLFAKCIRYIPSRYEGVDGSFSILISGSVDVGA